MLDPSGLAGLFKFLVDSVYNLVLGLDLPADLRAKVETSDREVTYEAYMRGEYCPYCNKMDTCKARMAVIARAKKAAQSPIRNELRTAFGALNENPE